MKLIKKIINWIKNFFKKIFKKNKKIKKKIEKNVNENINKRYLKGYGVFVNDSSTVSLPIYLMISEEEKKELIRKMEVIEEKIQEIKDINQEVYIDKVKKVITKIKNSDISFYQWNKINEKINVIINDVKLEDKIDTKINNLSKNIFDVIDNYDKNVKEKTIKEYKKVNYVTLTTLLIDETKTEIEKLEEDYHNHKYNKYYYEREIKKIKERINNLRKLRNKDSVIKEIELLKKELYTKNKDKYDLLYNDEVFLDIDKYCDDLLKQINRKVVDIKKVKEEKEIEKESKEEKKEQKKEQKQEEEEKEEMLENILKRFYDMELARKILLLANDKDIKIENINDLISYLNKSYYDFINGERIKFNFERNKTKTELIKLYNSIGRINASLKKEDFLFQEHINYPLDELLMATISKKEELDDVLKSKFGYKEEENEVSILVNNKLDILLKTEEEKNNDRNHVLIKKMDSNSL